MIVDLFRAVKKTDTRGDCEGYSAVHYSSFGKFTTFHRNIDDLTHFLAIEQANLGQDLCFRYMISFDSEVKVAEGFVYELRPLEDSQRKLFQEMFERHSEKIANNSNVTI